MLAVFSSNFVIDIKITFVYNFVARFIYQLFISASRVIFFDSLFFNKYVK